ncbi:ABC transporter [Pokkaliibacter plantistimulans]|uniref:Transport permease protein n=1 Tax=Pokkaliibacter plantistimulans TaxID=1635171 RepID=A0ABX5LYQ7_9GAMM|nr:ABC transporter permease [Pokkaliibacter plantistimulans]PXF31827.1 ABC transporter [Pokkaliibacter plantistimulans]
MLLTVWKYREFIIGSVKREFQARYRNSILGMAWTVLNPLSMIVVYTVIFSHVMKNKLAGVENEFGYSIYLCAGVLTWGLFSETVNRIQDVFINNGNLIKKVNFPKLCLPVTSIMISLLNFGIIFTLFTLFLVATGNFPGVNYIWLFPVLLIQILFSLGLGVVLGVLNVFFRDVGQFFGIFLQLWFWATPIVYPESILPEWFKPVMGLNPMADLIAAYHTILIEHTVPGLESLVYVIVLTILVCALAVRIFKKHSADMVDEL